MRKLLLKVTSGPKHSFSVTREDCKKFYDEFHYHPEFELTLIIKGRGTRFVGDHIATFQDGDLVLVGKNLPHVWKSEVRKSNARSSSVAIHFGESFLGSEFFELPELAKVSKLLKMSSRGLLITGDTRAEIAEVMVNMCDLTPMEKLISLLRIFDVLTKSNKFRFLSTSQFSSIYLPDNSNRIREVFNYVVSNFRQSLTLEEIAGVANMSPTAFCRYFKQRARKTFSVFLNEVRVSYACQLLKESDKKIVEVSFDSGFSNLSNFNKQFKAIMKCTPSEYSKAI